MKNNLCKLKIECFDFYFPPNPRRGNDLEVCKIKLLFSNYSSGVPPWGLGGK